MKKLFFRFNSPCFIHLFPTLLGKQIIKNSKWERAWDVYGPNSGTKLWDVLGTPARRRSYMLFKFNSQIYQAYFDGLLKTL